MPKMENIPPCPAAVSTQRRQTQLRIELETVTIMVGGGAVSGQIDESLPIRVTAIRGSLRYFWRLLIGHKLGDGMKLREEEVFGSTEFPSPVSVSVEILSQPKQIDPTNENHIARFGPLAYALFPSIENKQLVTKPGLKFAVRFLWLQQDELDSRRTSQNKRRKLAKKEVFADSIDSIDNDLMIAIYAWIAFGGVGGRTRRGCGAIHCTELSSTAPTLPARIFLGQAANDATEAWETSLKIYRDFRQTPRGNKHKKTLKSGKIIPVPGRSHWPEADSIRKVTGCSLKPKPGMPASGVSCDEDTHDHSVPVVPQEILPAFPKAVLGLPINFHFADGPGKRPGISHLDPKSVQLYPLLVDDQGRAQKYERMASPILTRPLWKDGKWYPAIFVLQQSLPIDLQFRLEGREADSRGKDLKQDFSLKHVIGSNLGSLRPMLGKSSAIDALVEFIQSKQHGFHEVTQ